MNTALSYQIRLVDQTAGPLSRINAAIAKVARPTRDLGASLANVGRAAGLDKAVTGMTRLGSAAFDSAKRIALITPAISTIASAASVAGVAMLTKNFAQSTIAAENLARRIGMSSNEMRAFQVAGERVGISADTSAASLLGLANSLEQVKAQNPDFIELANYIDQFGLSIKRLPNGAIDAVDFLGQIADKYAALQNPQARESLAKAFNVSEMAPLLALASAGIGKLLDTVRAYAATLDKDGVSAAERYTDSLSRLGESTTKLSRTLAIALVEPLTAVVDVMTDLTKSSEGWIRANVPTYAREFATAFKSVDWKQIGSDIGDMFTKVEQAAPRMDTITRGLANLLRPVNWLADKLDQLGEVEWMPKRIDRLDTPAPPLLPEAKKPAIAPGNLFGKAAHVARLEAKYGLPPGSLAAIRKIESNNGDPRWLTSEKGAMGEFQLMRPTADDLGVSDPYDFMQSSDGAARHLRRLLKKYNGDLTMAYAAYNGGEGRLDRNGLSRMPPETQQYVTKAMRELAGTPAGLPQAGPALGASAAEGGKVDVNVRFDGLPPNARVSVTSSGNARGKVSTGRTRTAEGSL